jgi:hypothetical protein
MIAIEIHRLENLRMEEYSIKLIRNLPRILAKDY